MRVHFILRDDPLTQGCGFGRGAFYQPLEHARFFDVATEEPMVAGVAGRYAAALFDLAGEQGVLANVEQDLVKIKEALDISTDLHRLIRSPVISGEDQARALAAVMQSIGVASLAQNFLQLVARNRRLFALPDMISAFRALAAKARGEVTASVASAHPLTDVQTDELKSALKASVGKDVLLRTSVDPALIGGLVVKLGSRMVDSSIKTKLSSLKVSLKGGV